MGHICWMVWEYRRKVRGGFWNEKLGIDRPATHLVRWAVQSSPCIRYTGGQYTIKMYSTHFLW